MTIAVDKILPIWCKTTLQSIAEIRVYIIHYR